MSNLEQQITALGQKIQNIDAKRGALVQVLSQLKHQQLQIQQNPSQHTAGATVTQNSPSQDKVRLFRNLFSKGVMTYIPSAGKTTKRENQDMPRPA